MSQAQLQSKDPRLTAEDREAALEVEIEKLRKKLREKEEAERDPLTHANRPSSRRVFVLLFLAAVVLAAAVVFGWLPKMRRQAEIKAEAKSDTQELPVVTVVPARRAESISELSLPANIQAVTEAPILARADGYLKRRYVDIGDHVRAGQLLAEVEAPELDQQVQQGRANVEQARAGVEQAKAAWEQGKANRDLARVSAERWGNLLTKGAVSRQENDQYQAQYQAQAANVEALDKARNAAERSQVAAQANLDRLIQVQSYKQVRSPFAGVITLRNIDTGALITSGQTLLFRVAQDDLLRAYINIPQSDSQSLTIGEGAVLTLSQFPGRKFEGTVVRSASALDPSSRTLLAEVRVPNTSKLLLPGMYAQVLLRHRQSHPPVLAAGDTMMINDKGTQIAVVDSQSRVRLTSVVVGRDFGRELEVLQGLEPGDLLIANPNDTVREGVKVRAEQEKAEGGNPAKTVNGTPVEKRSPAGGADVRKQ